MDWSRAKSVLIFSFLLLNVLLGYQLWLDLKERLQSDIGTELPPETVRVMQEKNIRLLGSLPGGTPQLSDLTYRFANEAGMEAAEPLETPVDSRIIFSEKELQEGLGAVIPELEHYAYDPDASTDGVFVLYRMTVGLPMFDVRLELLHREQKIVAYRQTRRIAQVQPGEELSQSMLSAPRVISSLIENSYIQPGSVIKGVRLGLKGEIFESETQVAAPSWRVLLEDGTEFYMNAINADVVVEQDSQVNERP